MPIPTQFVPEGSKIYKGYEDQGALNPEQYAQVSGTQVATREPRVADPLSDIQSELASGLQNVPSSATIAGQAQSQRANVMGMLDTRIADIDASVAQQIRDEEEEEIRRLGGARGINVRAGLAGSPFAVARKEGIRGDVKRAKTGIREQGQRDIATARGDVQNILLKIDENTQLREQSASQARLGYLEASAGIDEKIRTDAIASLTQLAEGGTTLVDLEEIQDESGKSLLSELSEQLGQSEDLTRFQFQAQQPETEYTKPEYFWEGGNLIAVSFDKSTGEHSKETFSAEDLGITTGTDIDVITNKDSGEVFWYDKSKLGTDEAKLIKLGDIGGAGGGIDLGDVRGLKKEFEALQEVQDFQQITSRFQVLEAARLEAQTTDNFVAVDQAIITLFNKITDPTSVVRESEYLRTASDISLWNQVKGKLAKVKIGGAGLTQSDRDAIVEMAGRFQEVAEKNFNRRRQEFTDFATSRDVGQTDLDFIIGAEREGSVETIDVAGQQVPVGTIIENGQGQQGRVEADGSITIIQ